MHFHWRGINKDPKQLGKDLKAAGATQEWGAVKVQEKRCPGKKQEIYEEKKSGTS